MKYLKKPVVLILDKDGRIDSQEYDNQALALEAFYKIVGMLDGDEFERVVRVTDGVNSRTFDSKYNTFVFRRGGKIEFSTN